MSREFKRNHHKPLNFYEFVCDPTSFADGVAWRRAVEVGDDDDTMVKKMVKSLHQDLSREIKRSHQKPINFYEFVCDPASFADGVAVREDVDDADPDKRNPQQSPTRPPATSHSPSSPPLTPSGWAWPSTSPCSTTRS